MAFGKLLSNTELIPACLLDCCKLYGDNVCEALSISVALQGVLNAVAAISLAYIVSYFIRQDAFQ